jgi:hypothetical protein
MAQAITIAGERLFALKAQNNEQLDIDTFIFANVPGQDSNATIDRNEGLPPVAQRVHQQIVQQVGRINDNVVVYSTVLDSVTGPFDFNWVGLYSSANQTLIAVSHIPNVSKTITVPGTAGNTLNRNFGIEYSGIADLAGITVEPETWQLDFTARLSGMDELTRQLAADMNGKDWFIGDGFKVVPRSTTNTFKVTPGAGYVSGLRVELKQDHILTLQSYPQLVYVDAWFDGDASSKWAPKTAFTVTNGEMDDYIDVNGKPHYVFKLARITAADAVEDLRSIDGLAQRIDKSFRTGLLVFSTVNNLQTGTTLNGIDVDFNELAQSEAVVRTRWRDNVNKDNGQSYMIMTAADFAAVPDGIDDFYVGGGNSFVAVGLKEAFKRVRVGSNPLANSASKRDANYVGRDVKGLTDCHAYTDRTVIKDVTDSGTYGAFDAVTKVEGEHAQSHLFAFQDRQVYAGSGAGTINTWGGNIIWPELAGNGHVNNRYGQWIKDVNNSGGGTIGSQIGILIEDLNKASSNVAINLAQSSGYTMFAPNAGKWLLGGNTTINGTTSLNGTTIVNAKCYLAKEAKVGGLANGTAPILGVALTVERDGLNTRGFLDANTVGVSVGVEGDKKIQLTTNAVARVVIEDSANGYDLRPSSNSQKLGNATFRWSEVFSLNGAINTSDENEKQQVFDLTSSEKLVAKKLKNIIKSYKFNDSVIAKGDKARIHIGAIAQQVKATFESEGLDAMRYGIVCFDSWDDVWVKKWVNKGAKNKRTIIEKRHVSTIERRTVKEEELTERDGKYISRFVDKEVEVEVKQYQEFPVVDENGLQVFLEDDKPYIITKPVIELVETEIEVDQEPIYEDILEVEAGSRFGLRYDELAMFIIGGID